MTKYVCKNCRFAVESEKVPARCPYCDRKSMEKEQNADEILSSIE
jgi:DNA-directed RNA polymerase subunit RPC12/RpoP